MVLCNMEDIDVKEKMFSYNVTEKEKDGKCFTSHIVLVRM